MAYQQQMSGGNGNQMMVVCMVPVSYQQGGEGQGGAGAAVTNGAGAGGWANMGGMQMAQGMQMDGAHWGGGGDMQQSSGQAIQMAGGGYQWIQNQGMAMQYGGARQMMHNTQGQQQQQQWGQPFGGQQDQRQQGGGNSPAWADASIKAFVPQGLQAPQVVRQNVDKAKTMTLPHKPGQADADNDWRGSAGRTAGVVPQQAARPLPVMQQQKPKAVGKAENGVLGQPALPGSVTLNASAGTNGTNEVPGAAVTNGLNGTTFLPQFQRVEPANAQKGFSATIRALNLEPNPDPGANAPQKSTKKLQNIPSMPKASKPLAPVAVPAVPGVQEIPSVVREEALPAPVEVYLAPVNVQAQPLQQPQEVKEQPKAAWPVAQAQPAVVEQQKPHAAAAAQPVASKQPFAAAVAQPKAAVKQSAVAQPKAVQPPAQAQQNIPGMAPAATETKAQQNIPGMAPVATETKAKAPAAVQAPVQQPKAAGQVQPVKAVVAPVQAKAAEPKAPEQPKVEAPAPFKKGVGWRRDDIVAAAPLEGVPKSEPLRTIVAPVVEKPVVAEAAPVVAAVVPVVAAAPIQAPNGAPKEANVEAKVVAPVFVAPAAKAKAAQSGPVPTPVEKPAGRDPASKNPFLGSDFDAGEKVLAQLNDKTLVKKLRAGLMNPTGPPAREGADIETLDGLVVGKVTSGTMAPCIKKNISMGYINKPHNKQGTELQVVVRGKRYPATVTKMPFVPTKYYKI
ncbi:unnamed protein product [Polarella glacialis]|uniref:Aminomethyltransferase C-terminal domain-containing protein n=1 Tax=Polarella glacialis TaxID=89957 RepID=A0A813FW31_POLGL|nr:unnamed protein product [Polarella glacialis]